MKAASASLLYRRLENSGKPWVAAINGTAMGGGFELCLACHHRVAADNPKTRLGLPEVKVGLFPGAGGTQRVARMIAPADALQFLLKGDQLPVERAKAMKLIDAVVPAADLIKTAKDWIKAGGKGVAPWDEKGFRLPGGPVYSRGRHDDLPGRQRHLPARDLRQLSGGARHPAGGLRRPAGADIDTGLRIESRWFAKILRSPQAAAMIRTLFVSMQEINKGARRPAGMPPTSLKTIGIVGAGFMGAGIAQVSAAAGLAVVLIDRDQETADKGKAALNKALSDRVMKGRMKGAERDALLAQITPSADYGALKDCDLVIEAVFEDRKVKAEVIKKIQAVIGDNVILASNTSTLPITSLASEFKDPARFIGIHFFSPVDRMLLTEIILGKETGDKALAAALDFVRAIRKTPIVVNDSRGFYANRCVINYLLEGHLMLLEGIPPAMIETVARMAGMPVGPLALNDETGLDLGLKIVRATEADLGRKAVNQGQKKLFEDMVEKNGRSGRKNGKGFYDYPQGQPKRLWPGLADILPKTLTRDEVEAIDVEELKARFLVVQAVEAARTFEEKVITDVREADVGSILGWGFAPYSGGTLSYIDMMGTKKFVELARRLEKKHGARFAPPSCSSTWPRPTSASTPAFPRRRRKRRRKLPLTLPRARFTLSPSGERGCERMPLGSLQFARSDCPNCFEHRALRSPNVLRPKAAPCSAGARSPAVSGRSGWFRCSWTHPPS